jgi:hypothetical protein
MKTNTANKTSVRQSVRRHLGGAFLLATTALFLQGCTTARPVRQYSADIRMASGSAFEPAEPRTGLSLMNLRF